jgi:hypothetical protein
MATNFGELSWVLTVTCILLSPTWISFGVTYFTSDWCHKRLQAALRTILPLGPLSTSGSTISHTCYLLVIGYVQDMTLIGLLHGNCQARRISFPMIVKTDEEYLWVRVSHLLRWPTSTVHLQKRNVLDATRVKDGSQVVLKRISVPSDELHIALYLSSANMRSDPRNHTISIIDVVTLPNDKEHVLIVMPYHHIFDSPPFHCCAEVVEAFRQFLQVCIIPIY